MAEITHTQKQWLVIDRRNAAIKEKRETARIKKEERAKEPHYTKNQWEQRRSIGIIFQWLTVIGVALIFLSFVGLLWPYLPISLFFKIFGFGLFFSLIGMVLAEYYIGW